MALESATFEIIHRRDLLARGMTPRQITNAVRDGRIVRIRRDHYALGETEDVDRCVRIGGRLACVSVLKRFGVFVLDGSRLHVHLARRMSRLRSPVDATRPLNAKDREGLLLHWATLHDERGHSATVSLADALHQSVRCQSARAAVATVDSILHLRLLTRAEIEDVFALLPRRYAVILKLADGSAESGPETFVRLCLRRLGLRFGTQVQIPGVGRVDFLVEGWLIVECDSREFHEGWEKQKNDRERDLAAGALGYATIRPLAQHAMFDELWIRDAVLGLISGRRARLRR